MIKLIYLKRNSKKIYNANFCHVDVALSFLNDLFKNNDIKCFSFSYISEEDMK